MSVFVDSVDDEFDLHGVHAGYGEKSFTHVGQKAPGRRSRAWSAHGRGRRGLGQLE